MAAPKTYFERHSLAIGLQQYLVTAGWTDITKVLEGWQSDASIEIPAVSVYFLPSHGTELQMGRDGGQKSFVREIQIDCYMESEPRAMAIVDDIAEYLDTESVSIVHPNTTVLGVMYTQDFEAIITDVLPPIMTESKVNRWRGVVHAPLEAHYLN